MYSLISGSGTGAPPQTNIRTDVRSASSKVGQLAHEQEHGRHPEHRRHPVPADVLEAGRRIEGTVQEHDLAALLPGHERGDVEATDVEERGDDQGDVVCQ